MLSLNEKQKEAVQTTDGAVLIIAGAGSGKTRVITQRITYLVNEQGVAPHRIMAVTFTNKASREMQNRLDGLEGLTIGTFHAVCAKILRVDGKEIGLDNKFTICDDSDQLSLLKRTLLDLQVDPKKLAPRAFQSAISSAKSKLITPDSYTTKSYFEEVTKKVYQRYQELLRQNKSLDFDDLIMVAVDLFRRSEQVLEKYQSRYLHLLIDEFQDTNIAQYTLSKLIAGKHRNICVVGDPDQSIYSWRNADIRNILSFERDYPEAKAIYLEQNYRSTQTILDAARNVISKNKDRKEKELWTENEPGKLIQVIEVYNEVEEARFVVKEVQRLIRMGSKLTDFAVMYRTNAQSRAIEDIFIQYQIPYKLVGAIRFYERKEIKDLLAYLKVIYNHNDVVSIDRIINTPSRGIGQSTLMELHRLAADSEMYSVIENIESLDYLPSKAKVAVVGFRSLIEGIGKELPPGEILDQILESGYKGYIEAMEDGEDRLDNIAELKGIAAKYPNLETFLEAVSLVTDIEEDDKRNAVTLITLHKTKGLEFPCVFIVGVEEDILPHYRSADDPKQMEEERRLCYVGMTRAEKVLYMIHAKYRNLMGNYRSNEPSRYLDDIPSHLIYGKEEVEQKGLKLIEGDKVRHTKFGEGIVLRITNTARDQIAVIDFNGHGQRRVLVSLSPLVRI